MRRLERLAWLVVMVAAAAAAPAAAAGKTGAPEAWSRAELDPDGDVRIVVLYRSDLPAEAVESRASRRPAGARLRASFGRIKGEVVKVRPERLAETVAQIEADPDVLLAEPDRRDQHVLRQAVPWGIRHVYADPASRGARRGAGVKVAVIDTGIWFSPSTGEVHRDLAAVYAGGYDFIDDDGVPEDAHGHGTHVAGTVAAADNLIGVVGAAPGVRLYALKTIDDTGIGYFSDFISALEWCVANGVRIANYSVGGPAAAATVEEACERARAAGVTIVAAAGNGGDILYPAAFSSVIAVGAVDPSHVRPFWSGAGAALDFVAPGVGVRSTYLDGRYARLDGTSMAAPHVTGVVALLAGRGITQPIVVEEYLKATATDLGTAGRDPFYGSGLVNARKRVPARPAIRAPLAGEVIGAGEVYRINWDPVAGAVSYRVLFSRNGGGTWNHVVSSTTATARLWRAPAVSAPLEDCRVQVAAYRSGGRLIGVNTVRSLTIQP